MVQMTLINIPKSRRNEIKSAVLSALEHHQQPELPFKIKAITRSYKNIRLISYSKHMRNMDISYSQMIAFTKSKDACTDYYVDHNLYYIYYNDIDSNIMNSNRYRWNIAHELGHVLLDHHKNYDRTRIFRNSLTSDEYNLLEAEADYFAQLILVPHAAILGFRIESYLNIRVLCKISDPAAKKRYYEYSKWKRHIDARDQYDKSIFRHYFNFIYKRECKTCGANLIQRYGKYCPICGSRNTLQWGEGKMIYPKYATYENGKLKECPNCKNEETDIIGGFCQICGRNLVNYCSYDACSHQEPLPTNARYCPICGSNSTFYNAGFLKEWDCNEQTSFLDIPNELDEELPFN